MIFWKIEEEFKGVFSPDVLQRFAVENRDVRKETVRELENRKTIHVFTPPDYPDIFVKTFIINSFKYFLQGSSEWEKSKKLISKGLPTHKMIAFGVEGISFLKKRIYIITEEIKGAVSLHDFCRKRSFSFSRSMVISFACFIRELHLKGVFHKDLHWKNILIKNSSKPEFFIIDPISICFKTAYSAKDIVSNLALLNLSFNARIDEKYQVLFLNEYFRKDVNKKRFKKNIVDETFFLQSRKRRKLVKRYCSTNKYFSRFKTGDVSGCYRKDEKKVEKIGNFTTRRLQELIKESICIKDSRTTSVYLNKELGIFIKKYNYKGIINSIKNSLFDSRGERAWVKSNSLFDMNVETPKPLFYLEKKICGFVKYSLFSTDSISGAMSLKVFYENCMLAKTFREKIFFIKKLAAEIKNFHDMGVSHGDMKEKNILAADKHLIFFTDCDAIKFNKKISLYRRCRDIARLNLSLHNLPLKWRLRFLDIYLKGEEEKRGMYLKKISSF